MQRCVEVNVDTHSGMVTCAVCGGEMEPFVGWEVPDEGWVVLWWRCEDNDDHHSSPLPFSRVTLREMLEPRV